MKINKKNTKLLPIVMLAMPGLMYATQTKAAPVEFDGHHYEVVVEDGISWESARDAAESMSYGGVQGHLVTITSAEEDAFVESLRQQANLNRFEVWAGGFQAMPCNSDPGCSWTWLVGEGTFDENGYTNWLPGEPNDNYGVNSESYVGIGLRDEFGWNDEKNLNNIGGYVVEYDTAVTFPAEECLLNNGGCSTLPNNQQVLILPQSTKLAANAQIGVRSFDFTDDPARCGNEKLVLFGDPNDDMPSLIIPPYLCAFSDFRVVRTETTGVEILEGTVLVENNTVDVVPDNEFVACEDPIFQNFPSAGDPQRQDVVVWQATDGTTMLENDLGSGLYEGTAGEFTNGCGSSRGRVRGLSYWVIGLSINFGPGNSWAGNSAGSFDNFVALTRYKLEVLERSVRDSSVALGRWQYRGLLGLVQTTDFLVRRGNYRLAWLSNQVFLTLAERTRYDIVPGKNFSGEHLMRADNIGFTLRVKVIPYQ